MNVPNVFEPKSFGKKADEFLAKYYASYGAETLSQKIRLLRLQLGRQSTGCGKAGGHITDNDEVELGCLEYDFLEHEKQIELVLA